jgi:N-acetylglutamate synthase-like GNAT family acetyltransferase
MADPRITGMSGITDKIVYIRHAQDADIVNIREALKSNKAGRVDLSCSDVVVALEDQRMIGFGILEREGRDAGAGCLSLVEKGGRRGIGLSILRHLLEHAEGVSRVIASRDLSRYLSDIGFHRGRKGAACKSGRPEGETLSCCGAERKGLATYQREQMKMTTLS